MNMQEYELIAEVFKRHRASYSNRTDAVALELLADMIRALEDNYESFKKFRFYEALGLTLDDVEYIERKYLSN